MTTPQSPTGFLVVEDKRWDQVVPGDTMRKPGWLKEHGPVVEAPAEGYPLGFAVKFADGHVTTRPRDSETTTQRPATPAEVEEMDR